MLAQSDRPELFRPKSAQGDFKSPTKKKTTVALPPLGIASDEQPGRSTLAKSSTAGPTVSSPLAATAPMSTDDLPAHPLKHAGAGRFWKPEDECKSGRLFRRRPHARNASQPAASGGPARLPRESTPPAYLTMHLDPDANTSTASLPTTGSATSYKQLPDAPHPDQLPSRGASGGTNVKPVMSEQDRARKAAFHLTRLQEMEDVRVALMQTTDDDSITHGSSSTPSRNTSNSSNAKSLPVLPTTLRLSFERPRGDFDIDSLLGLSPRANRRRTSSQTSTQIQAELESEIRTQRPISSTSANQASDPQPADLTSPEVPTSKLPSESEAPFAPTNEDDTPKAEQEQVISEPEKDKDQDPPVKDPVAPSDGNTEMVYQISNLVSSPPMAQDSDKIPTPNPSPPILQDSDKIPTPIPSPPIREDSDPDDSLFSDLKTIKSRLSQQPGARQSRLSFSSDNSRFRSQSLSVTQARDRNTLKRDTFSKPAGLGLTSIGASLSSSALVSPPEFHHTLTPPLPEHLHELSTSPSVARRPRTEQYQRAETEYPSRPRTEQFQRSETEYPSRPRTEQFHRPVIRSSRHYSDAAADGRPIFSPPFSRPREANVEQAPLVGPFEPPPPAYAVAEPSFKLDIEPDIDPRTGRQYVAQNVRHVVDWSTRPGAS